jgi:hypothetical protein
MLPEVLRSSSIINADDIKKKMDLKSILEVCVNCGKH